MDEELKNELAALDESAEGEPPPEEVAQRIDPEVQKKNAEKNKAEQEWVTIFEQVLAPAFAIVTPAWNIQKEEIEALSEAYGAVAHKHYPDGVGSSPEIMAIATTAIVFGPRIVNRVPRTIAPVIEDEVPPEQLQQQEESIVEKIA